MLNCVRPVFRLSTILSCSSISGPGTTGTGHRCITAVPSSQCQGVGWLIDMTCVARVLNVTWIVRTRSSCQTRNCLVRNRQPQTSDWTIWTAIPSSYKDLSDIQCEFPSTVPTDFWMNHNWPGIRMPGAGLWCATRTKMAVLSICPPRYPKIIQDPMIKQDMFSNKMDVLGVCI